MKIPKKYRVVLTQTQIIKNKYDLQVSYFWIPIWFDAGYEEFNSLESAENEIKFIRSDYRIKKYFKVEENYE